MPAWEVPVVDVVVTDDGSVRASQFTGRTIRTFSVTHGYSTALGVTDAAATRPGVRWISLWRDVSATRENGVPLHRWIPWALSCEAKCAVAWDDSLPLLGASLHRAAHRRGH